MVVDLLSRAKSFARELCPPIAWKSLSRLKPAERQPTRADLDRIGFTGHYQTWEEAERDSEGYAAEEILAKTRSALLKVKNGEAAFERDSVVFDVMQYEFPLLASLLRAAAASRSRLSVLDFGGALGSTYFQCRSFLRGLNELRWSVVEQASHVACGRTDFADDQLRFYLCIDECLRVEKPNVLLLSSVIQYLAKPYDFLNNALRHEFEYVIVDRTAFMRNGQDRLTVQHVPASIYKASYPAWFLSERRFLDCFRERYTLEYDFAGADRVQPDGGEAYFKGFQFQLKSKVSST